MRQSFLIGLIFILPTFISSCNKSNSSTDLVGNWVNRYNFDGIARSHAVGFTIGDKSYLVGGYDGDNRVRINDTWQYDPIKNQWLKMAEFPGIGRTSAVAFAINGKGYVGLGYDGTNKLNDFWEYDPTNNTWTQKNNIPENDGFSARYGSVAFSIGSKGYVLGGYDGNYLKDLWEYDPTADSWSQKTSLPGSKRMNAVAFVIDNIAYVCTGIENAAYPSDFWAYDASTDTWAKKRDIANNSDQSYDDEYTSIVRENAVAFVINGLGYIATGDNTVVVSTVWEYDPATDLWKRKTDFEGAARSNALGMTVSNRGFVVTGKTGNTYLDDLWEFDPNATYNKYDK